MRDVPRPYFDEYSTGTSPLTRAEDRRLFPDPRTMAREFFPSLGRSFDVFANLISPEFIFNRDGWTDEQRAVGHLLSEIPRGMSLSRDPADFIERHNVELPQSTAALQGFVETTPLGSRGWTGFVEHLEQEPAELPLELALMGAGKAITGARRLTRAVTPFDTDVFDRTDLLTGQRLPSAAEASVSIQTYRGARLLEEASGIRVGPQMIATASHVVAGKPGMPFSPTIMTARGLESGQTGMIRGVQGILPEADIALLEAVDVSDAYLPLSDLVPGLSHEAVGDLGAGLETFSGAVGPRRYTDLATGAAIAETTLGGRGGLSGAGLVSESGDVSGVYLGTLGQRGLFATSGTVSDFQRQVHGRAPIPVSQLQTGTITDALRNQGLHYRLARQDPTLSVLPFLLGGLSLHGRYGVQEPFSLTRLDPTRHREFDEGPVSGVFAYEGDLRDMLFEIKTPGLNWERRESLLEYLRSETELEYIPDIFREGGYDAITAVPSSVDRLRQRGFNQAEFYAEIFSDVLGIPFQRDLLHRTRQTIESSRLEGRLSREANLTGVFRADPSVAGQRILTIDDIAATGTTMRETLAALRGAGVEEAGGLAVASSLHNFVHRRAGLSRFSQDIGESRLWSGTDFTTSQERAISHLEGPAVISAVPGAGKTDVLVERVQQLMAGGVSPSEVLTVAYNRAAIEELASRFESAGLGAAQARTVHSLAYEITMDPDNFTGVGFSHRPKIATELTQERFRQMMRQYPDAQVDFSQSPSFEMAAGAETDADWLAAYQEYKRERGLMTFGQMLDVGAEILETQPDVRQRYLEKYPYLQIDEFQDISQREWNFLSKWTPNVLGVGDINQAIYGFRGATGEVMADLYRRSIQYLLPETFRSTPEIFQTAQRLIGLNEERIPIQGRSVLSSGSPVDFRSTTGDTVFDELEALLGSRHTDESTAVLVRTNREIKRILDTLGEKAFENVDIGTIHKGKGQGWDRVILPMETVPVRFGDSPETIWSPRMRSQTDIENARRVGYVGLTRARQRAHVLGGGDLFEEMRTGERHLQLHGRHGGLREGFSYGFDRKIEGVPTLEDFNEFVQRHQNLFLRATHGLEDTLEQQSLDWAQTLGISMRLRESGVDIPIRGEESALFPRSIYDAHKREIDYMVAPGSFIGESQWEPGMMGVFQEGVYGVKDLELLLKHAYWNPTPRLHMGGRELRLLEGQELKSGFQVSLPPDAQGFAPPGEFIIKPERMLGLFDYEDIIDLGTGDPFRGQPMDLQYELSRYGLEGLRPIDELEKMLQLHGRSGKNSDNLTPMQLERMEEEATFFLSQVDDFMPSEEDFRSYREADILDVRPYPGGADLNPHEDLSRLGTDFYPDSRNIFQRFESRMDDISWRMAEREELEDYLKRSEQEMPDYHSGEVRRDTRGAELAVGAGVSLGSGIGVYGLHRGWQHFFGNQQTENQQTENQQTPPSPPPSESNLVPVSDPRMVGRRSIRQHSARQLMGTPVYPYARAEMTQIVDNEPEINLIDDRVYRNLPIPYEVYNPRDPVLSEGMRPVEFGMRSDAPQMTYPPQIPVNHRVDINTASAEILQEVLELSKKVSERIMDYRQAQGDFETSEQLAQQIKGLTDKRVQELEPYILPLGRSDTSTFQGFSSASPVLIDPMQRLLDINTATLDQLQGVRGVGVSTAQRILESRETDGVFPSLQSLSRVKGIGPATVERLSPYLRDFGLRDHASVPLYGEGANLPAFAPAQGALLRHRPLGTGLDINTATAADFARLPTMSAMDPEITPEIAQRIIEYRNSLGGFTDVSQLGHVSGVDRDWLEDLMDTGRFEPLTAFQGSRDIGYQRPYTYPSDMRDHIPFYEDGAEQDPAAPLWDALDIEEVPLESGFEYSLRKFQEAQGGATRFSDPSSRDEGYSGRRRGYHRQYDLQAGLQAEVSYLPQRALRHFSKHGTEGLGEMLTSYPGEAVKRQGTRVLQNYATDTFKNFFRPEGQKIPTGIENYLGDTLGTGLKEAFANPLGAVAGAAALAAFTAYIGESSLDANYADVIESEEMRKQRFYDRFREQPLSRAVEVGGKALQPGGLEKLIEGVVQRVLAEGTGEISDKLVTKIGRKIRLQMDDGRL